MPFRETKSSNRNQRLGAVCAAGASITYSLIVIWYVVTFPDVGVRALLPKDPDEQGLYVSQFIHPEEDCLSTQVVPGQRLLTLGRRPAGNFLLYTHALADLRSAPIPPEGALASGADPSELPEKTTPGLVSIAASADNPGGAARRMVELTIRQKNGSIARTYVPVKSMPPGSFLPTIFWFLCQLTILVVALAAWWQRPSDRVIRIFCLMCSASMPAFVGGFHWWILVATPILNLPFVFSACLLPAVTLEFFCNFPRESGLIQGRKRAAAILTYGIPSLMAALLGFTYWTAYMLSGASTGSDDFSSFQKLVAVTSSLVQDGPLSFHSAYVCAQLLYILRLTVYSAIVVSSTYFGLSVVSLALSLMRSQSPVERRQASGILVASLISTVPVLYTLYLAFFRRTEFALGKAQIPMFIASGLIMTAYAHGMMKHRLILAEEVWMRRRQYLFISGLVTCVSSIVLALGAVATRVHGLPIDASMVLKLSLFLVLVVAIGIVLWARDRIQSVVDQRFFSEKYQLDKTLKQLNSASGYLTDPSALAKITLGTCRDVMDASTVSMYVREASGSLRLIGSDDNATVPTSLSADVLNGTEHESTVIRRQVAFNYEGVSPLQELLHELSATLLCFLRGESGVDGMIILGKRTNGTAYSAEDISFLQAIGQMTGLALHSSRANQNLARLSSELEAKVDRIAEQQRQLSLLRAELTVLQDDTGDERDQISTPGLDRGEIRGNGVAMQRVFETVRKAAASTSTVLVRGESGTGKELLAKVVHRNSDRADKPLVSVNCAALAPSLLESELFGHVRGAFTGANSDKEGRFQAANGGTLFLDEIGDISQETQVKLLRVLQERCFEPVGSSKTVNVDVRVITATNRDLEQMIEDGEFREDLYYRLNVVSITLPALRDRRDDLIELVFFFLNRSVQKTGKRIRQIAPDALAAIEQHSWPGNVRELENAIERAVVLADGDTITLKDLPEQIRCASVIVMENARSQNGDWKSHDEYVEGPSVQATLSHSQTAGTDERQRIQDALKAANGNKARAARALDMPRSTFYSKLKKLNLS